MTTEVMYVCLSRCLECGRRTRHEVCRHTPHDPPWTTGEYGDWQEAIWAQNFDAAPEACPDDCPGDVY